MAYIQQHVPNPKDSVKWSAESRSESAVRRALERVLSPKYGRKIEFAAIHQNDNSGIQFNPIEYNQAIFVIASFIDIPTLQSEVLKQAVVGDALFALAKEPVADIEKLRQLIAAEVIKRGQRPLERFTVVYPTNITYSSIPPAQSLQLNTVKLIFRNWSYVRRHFDCSQWENQTDRLLSRSKFIFHENAACVVCTLEARDRQEAIRIVSEDWSRVRALLSFTALFGRITMSFAGFLGPLAFAMPSPSVAVFSDSDTPDTLKIFGNQEAVFSEWSPTDLKPDHMKYVRWWTRQLGFAPATNASVNEVRRIVGDAIVRYGEALESVERRACFIGLWQILELIAYRPSGVRFSIEDIRKRVAILLKDNEQLTDYLFIAYRLRNSYVHSGVFSDELQTTIHALKAVVEMCISTLFILSKEITTWDMLEAYYQHIPLSNQALSDRQHVIARIQSSRPAKTPKTQSARKALP